MSTPNEEPGRSYAFAEGAGPPSPTPPRPIYGAVPRYGHAAPPAWPISGPVLGQPTWSAGPPVPGPPEPWPPTGLPSTSYRPAAWAVALPVYPYTPWGRRVGAYLIDVAPSLLATAPIYVGYALFSIRLIQVMTAPPNTPGVELFEPGLWMMLLGLVLVIAAVGWQWYNRWLVAGRTGQSLGKRLLGISLVAEATGQPIGPLNAFLRDLLHTLDGAAYIGYLWPLWDAKRQTFADMLMTTVVIDRPTA